MCQVGRMRIPDYVTDTAHSMSLRTESLCNLTRHDLENRELNGTSHSMTLRTERLCNLTQHDLEKREPYALSHGRLFRPDLRACALHLKSPSITPPHQIRGLTDICAWVKRQACLQPATQGHDGKEGRNVNQRHIVNDLSLSIRS